MRAIETTAELMALPDATPRLGYVERWVGLNKVRVPTVFSTPFDGALFQKEEDGQFVDGCGAVWVTGWVGGVRVRRLVVR